MTTSDRFEDRLLQQLRHVVAERPAPARTADRRPRRTRLALAGAGVVAATAAVAIVTASNDATPSAYAVQARAGGAVTVSIRSLSDAAGLQRSLRDAGIPAVVDYRPVANGCVGPPSGVPEQGLHTQTSAEGAAGPLLSQRGTPPAAGAGEPRATSGSVMIGRDGAVTFTLDPGTLKPGEKVYITTSSGAVSSVAIGIGTHRPDPPCIAASPAS